MTRFMQHRGKNVNVAHSFLTHSCLGFNCSEFAGIKVGGVIFSRFKEASRFLIYLHLLASLNLLETKLDGAFFEPWRRD
jgi:hypothetical protein